MKLRRLYKFIMLAVSGGLVFQAAASCSSDAMNSLVNSLSGTLTSALTSELSSYVSQMFSCTT